MSQSTKYGLAIMLPDPPAGELRRIQRECQLPPWEPTFDLHVTLVPPFNTKRSRAEVTRQFELPTLRAPFPLRLAGIDRFDNAESILYIRVWRSDQLRRLHDELAAAALAVRKPFRHEFTPHVTLANPAPKQAIDGYERCVAEKVGEYDFSCTGYSLLHLDEQAREWKPVHEYRFSL